LQGRSGDPSPKTARGVFRAMQAAAKFMWGSDDLAGKTVAIQGCGHVGYYLAFELARVGAKIAATDVDQEKLNRVVHEFGARALKPAEILAAGADILAPCAMGGILNDESIPQLKVKMVVGGANNQLLEQQRHGEMLRERGILYAPDYAANAGGVINGSCRELLGWDEQRTLAKVDAIYATLMNIFEVAQKEKIMTTEAADRLVEKILAEGQRE
jgi:leucine dehydrogenase